MEKKMQKKHLQLSKSSQVKVDFFQEQVMRY